VHRLAWFDAGRFTLYLYNHANRTYRITADAIELVDNGTDGVLFLSDGRNEPFELVPDEDLGDLFHETVASRVNLRWQNQSHITRRTEECLVRGPGRHVCEVHPAQLARHQVPPKRRGRRPVGLRRK
jgi:hypothetical protein